MQAIVLLVLVHADQREHDHEHRQCDEDEPDQDTGHAAPVDLHAGTAQRAHASVAPGVPSPTGGSLALVARLRHGSSGGHEDGSGRRTIGRA